MQSTLSRVLILSLFALASVADEAPIVRFDVSAYKVTGDHPLPAAETEEILSAFTGTVDSVDRLLDAAHALEDALAEEGYAFHRVTVPPQALDTGTVELRVVVFRVGEVRVADNRHFSDDNIRRSLPGLLPGAAPNTKFLARELALANRHPAKGVRMNLKQSESRDAIDAELTVVDRKPWQIFAAANNIGTDDTGRSRLSVGGQYSNLFNRDHVLTASYTTSPENTDDVEQYGFSYSLPMYFLSGNLSAFYTKSDVDTGTVEQVFDVTGAGQFMGVSFSRLLLRRGNYAHEWSVSVQDRLFENDLLFGGLNLCEPQAGPFRSCSDVRSRPVTLQYDGRYRAGTAELSFYVSYARNIGTGNRNDDPSYKRNRFRADVRWDAIRFGGAVDYFFPQGWLGRVLMDGQITDEPLIPGEQFGLGGVHSVRGFEERNITADSGVRSSFEVWTPSAPFLENLRGLVFFDLGYKDLSDPAPGVADTDFVSSAGVGVRWHWKTKASLAVDYGNVVSKADADDRGSNKVHASLFVRF